MSSSISISELAKQTYEDGKDTYSKLTENVEDKGWLRTSCWKVVWSSTKNKFGIKYKRKPRRFAKPKDVLIKWSSRWFDDEHDAWNSVPELWIEEEEYKGYAYQRAAFDASTKGAAETTEQKTSDSAAAETTLPAALPAASSSDNIARIPPNKRPKISREDPRYRTSFTPEAFEQVYERLEKNLIEAQTKKRNADYARLQERMKHVRRGRGKNTKKHSSTGDFESIQAARCDRQIQKNETRASEWQPRIDALHEACRDKTTYVFLVGYDPELPVDAQFSEGQLSHVEVQCKAVCLYMSTILQNNTGLDDHSWTLSQIHSFNETYRRQAYFS